MRILIIKPSSVGDVVHALPTVNFIRRQFPDAHISWIINDTLASLLKNCPIIDELIPFRRRHFGSLRGAADFVAFLTQLQGKGFDLVVDLQGLFRSGLMAWATRAPRRLGLSDAREGARLFYSEVVKVPRAHAVERYLCAAHHLGCDDGAVEFPLGSCEADRKHVDELLHRSPLTTQHSLIALHPSARWPTKLWGDDKFAELLCRLPACRVVLTGSAAERECVDAIISVFRSTLHAPPSTTAPLNLAGQTDLAQLAELYRRCSVIVTNDSGPMHVAAAVGTPVVAVFGPTDPALTGPYGKRHVVLRAGISCSPCMKDRCSHTPRMECMSLVAVEQVLEAVKTFV